MHKNHFALLTEAQNKNLIPADLASIMRDFYLSYEEAIEENGYHIKDLEPLLNTFLQLVIKQLAHPFVFEPFHKKILAPFNYYRFGIDLMRPLIVFEKSKTLGLKYADQISEALERGENVILFANHQTEPDPQAISLLLEKTHPSLAQNMIFVAGHRVISDPLAVPFSQGINLLCVFSKRYIATDPTFKEERLLHNKRTMNIMKQLLNVGGKCIYVAPSGGRDRPCPKGKIDVAPFDPQSIEIFRLIGKNCQRLTRFYPLALATYQFLPPPNSVEKNLGERRHAHSTPIHLAFGKEIDIDTFVSASVLDKNERRKQLAQFIWKLVADAYAQL